MNSNIHLQDFLESPYQRGFNIVIFNLWVPVITSADSCPVSGSRVTEYFSVFYFCCEFV